MPRAKGFDGRTVFDAGYNWDEVFKYASTPQWVEGAIHPEPDPKHAFTLEDMSVMFYADGERDGAQWLVIGHLKDGTYGAVRAGCDYTGWGCQEWGDSARSNSYDDLIRWWLDAEERDRMGIILY